MVRAVDKDDAMLTLPSALSEAIYHFYARQHICYSAYMLSPVRLSVRKTVEDRSMKFSPYGSLIPLVFAG